MKSCSAPLEKPQVFLAAALAACSGQSENCLVYKYPIQLFALPERAAHYLQSITQWSWEQGKLKKIEVEPECMKRLT
jgi:hypothetical protein